MRAQSMVLLLMAMSTTIWAVDSMKPVQGSAEFERMKSLAGVWKGNEVGGHGSAEVRVEYRITAAGSAVEEKLFPGTPHEMVSLYYDEGGQLAMTHYCMLGNHPRMQLQKAAGNTLLLALAPQGNGDLLSQPHMHQVELTLTDPAHLTQRWLSYENGKPSQMVTFTLVRLSEEPDHSASLPHGSPERN